MTSFNLMFSGKPIRWRMADGLAKFGFQLEASSRIFNSLPYFISIPFHANLMGTCFLEVFSLCFVACAFGV